MPDTSTCLQYDKSRKSHPHTYHFSEENDSDPLLDGCDYHCDPLPDDCDYPVHLQKLPVVEELITAKYHVIMSIYKINLGGTWKYRDQILNLQQENKEFLESILRPDCVLSQHVATLPILWLRKHQCNDPKNLKDLQVRKASIKDWLVF